MKESILDLVVNNVKKRTEQNIWGVNFFVLYPVAFLVAREVNWKTGAYINHLIRRGLCNPIEMRGRAWQFGDATR